jgi:hypothetical protein
MADMTMLNLVLGIILLLFGRKLFWLFVGVAGFLIGMDVAQRFFSGPETTRLLIALVIGIIGALLAVLFYKAAVAVAGFFIGGYLGVHLVQYLALHPPQSMAWVPYVVGGIIGAILILVILDWALIVLSSFAGATLIVHTVILKQFNMTLVYIGLVIVGILIQAGILLSRRNASA